MRIVPRVRIALMVSIAAGGCASLASAQGNNRVGLVVGFPSSVGVHWKASDRFAIRLDGSYTHTSTSSENTDESEVQSIGSQVITIGGINAHQESHSNGGTIGVSVLLDVKRSDRFAVYVAPRVSLAVTHSTSTINYELAEPRLASVINRVPPSQTITTTSNSPGVAASLGARSDINDHFTVFGEVGLAYARSSASIPSLGSSQKNILHTIGTRSGVGLTIFF